MRRLVRIALWCIIFGWGCLKPSDIDFRPSQGLSDEEFMWVLQVESDSLDQSRFSDALQSIAAAIVSGELPAYSSYGSHGKLDRTEIITRLDELGINLSELDGLQQLAEVFVLGNLNDDSGGKAQYLQLMYVDPLGLGTPQDAFGIYIEELDNQLIGLTEAQFNSISIPYLSDNQVVYVRTNEVEYLPQSISESDYLRKMIGAGKWRELQWLDGKLNSSGYERQMIDPQLVLEYSGTYSFGHEEFKNLFLTAEKQCLIADWEHRFQVEQLYAVSENEFFSRSGERYRFSKTASDSMLIEFMTGDSIYQGIGLIAPDQYGPTP